MSNILSFNTITKKKQWRAITIPLLVSSLITKRDNNTRLQFNKKNQHFFIKKGQKMEEVKCC